MDDATINKLREVIKAEYQVKIDKLTEEMDAELIALSRLAPRLKSLSPTETREVQAPVRSIRTKFPTEGNPSIKERLKGALSRMSGPFTSAELLDKAIHDATGIEIAKPTFQSILSRMIKDGEIDVVTKQFGNTPGTYKKPGEPTEKSTDLDLF